MNTELPYDLSLVLGVCSDRVTDEVLDLYQNICNTFRTSEYIGHIVELEYIDALLESQSITHTDAVDSVLEVLVTGAEECLHILGIGIDPDIPLKPLAVMLESLLDFDVTEFPETIYNIIEGSDDTEECLAEVLGFVTTIETHEWYEYITSVTPEFVQNLRRVLVEAIDQIEQPVIDQELYRKRKLLKEANPELSLVDYVTESSSLDDLYTLFEPQLADLSVESAVGEIIALAALADYAPESRLASLDRILEDHVTDDLERVRLNALVRSTKSRYEHVFYR